MRKLLLLPLLFLLLGVGQAQNTLNRSGTINETRTFVEIPITVNANGSTIIVDMQATGGDLDTLLYLTDNNGNIVAQNDDRLTSDTNSLIRIADVPAGRYTIIATRYGVQRGSTTGTFTLDYEISEETLALPEFHVSAADLTAAGFPEIAPHATAEWTVLAYYGGDTNLESAILKDIDEFEIAGGSNSHVRVIALVDRHPGFTDANGDWFSTRIFEIGADLSGDAGVVFPPTLDTVELADLGRRDTGDAETLAQFLVWAVQTYPANHYAVAFGGHGGAWTGLITDDSANGDVLEIPELKQAFDLAANAARIEKFDLLVNDACIMSSIEFHAATAEHFAYSLASPEVVVEPALDMTLFTRLLNGEITDLNIIGQDLIQTYMTRDVPQRPGLEREYLTFAMTDLDAFDPVIATTEHFAEIVNSDLNRYANLIGMARANAYGYSEFLGVDSIIDLGNFMQQIIALSADTRIVVAAQDVLTALNAARVYGSAGQQVIERTSYYNIYFPQTASGFDTAYFIDSPLNQWGQMLLNYFNAADPRPWAQEKSLFTYHPSIAPQVNVTRVYPEVSSTAFPPSVVMEVVGRRIARGSFTVDRLDANGASVRLAEIPIVTSTLTGSSVSFINDWKSGVDRSFFHWLPLNLPVISDGRSSNNELLIKNGDLVTLRGRYRDPGTEDWQTVAVMFDLDGQAQAVINLDQRNNSLASVEIPTGAEFETYNFSVRDDGVAKANIGNRYIWPEGGLHWTEEPTQSGSYRLGFLVESFGGTTGYDSVDVTVDNALIDETMRGYADINLGVNFQHPIEWKTVRDFGDRLETSAPDGETVLRVYYFPAQQSLYDIIGQAQLRYDLAPTQASQTVELGDTRALQYSHTYVRNGQQWRGYAIAAYRPNAKVGIVYSLEAPTLPGGFEAPALEPLFAELSQHLLLFDLNTDEGSSWDYRFINKTIPYPVPLAWRAGTDHFWTTYTDPESGSTIAITKLDAPDQTTGLENVLNGMIPAGVNAEDATRRLYFAEHHVWDSAQYLFERDGVAMVGRAYVTTLTDGVYAYRMETPQNEDTVQVFRNWFEPMIDGFGPPAAAIVATGGVDSTYIRAALMTANETCAFARRGELCFGDGPIKLALRDGATAERFSKSGDTTALDQLEAVEIGMLENGQIDPLSTAVLKIQANYADTEADQFLTITAFGGTTIMNNSPLPTAAIERLPVANVSDIRLNIRLDPNTTAPVVDSVRSGELVTAVARLENNSWLRVILPTDPSQRGWISSRYVTADPAVPNLKVEAPTQPNLANMQSIEVLFSEATSTSQEPLKGLLIQSPYGAPPATLIINGTIFQIAGGSSVFWSGERLTVREVNANVRTGAYALVENKRLPEAWTAAVLRGAARITTDFSAVGVRSLGGKGTAIGGTGLHYTPENGLNLTSTAGQMINLAVTEPTVSDVWQYSSGLTQEQLNQVTSAQSLFNAVDLNGAAALSRYYQDNYTELENVDDPSDFLFGDEALLDYLLNETEIDPQTIMNRALLDATWENMMQVSVIQTLPTMSTGEAAAAATTDVPAASPVPVVQPPVDFCTQNPNDPACLPVDYCFQNPSAPECAGVNTNLCEVFPNNPTCTSYCDTFPEDPTCGDFCQTHPSHPVCGGRDICADFPDAPGCKTGTTSGASDMTDGG